MVRTCIDFADMRLWEHYDNMDLFVVQTPLEEPVVVSIMGSGGEEYGISAFRGPDAFQQPHLITSEGKSAAKKINTIGFSMVYYRDMDHLEKKWLKSYNYNAHKSDWLPSIISKKPGQMMEMVEKAHDIKLMLYILKGIIKAQEEGNFRPQTAGLVGPKMLTIEVSGDVLEPDVHVTYKSFPGSRELLELCNQDILFEDLQSPPDVSSLPKLNETWVIVPVYVPRGDSAKDDCILAIAEEESHYILHADVIAMDVAEAIKTLYGVFTGDNAAESVGIPQKIIVAEKEFFKAISGHIQKWGIDVCYEKEHPVAKDIRESLQQDLPAFAKKHVVKHLEMPDIDLSVVPDDDDLQSWKIVQGILTNQFINFWHDSDYLRKNRPSKQFFGDADWEYYIDVYKNMMALPTYVTWAALTYRAEKNKPTFAEQLLAGDLPQSLRISLEALNKTYPSLYQIKKTDKKTGYIILKDLLLSTTVTVHDQGLSETAKPDWIAPLWVYSAGNFYLVDIAGPIFSPFDSTEVIDELQKLKLPAEPTPQWLQENAYIFGRLWSLYDEISEMTSIPPKLANTDGESLKFITAYFKYDNLKKVRDALLQRDDIDHYNVGDEYIWFRVNPDNPIMETTLLARIFFEDNKIKAEVNSKDRLGCLTNMLESIEGVHYINHNSRDVEDMLKKVPENNKDIVEEALPEEVLASVQSRMNKYYMDWLEKPNPALGNKTPRQTVKNKEGAQKIKILIETIPPPISSKEIKIPKKEMLKELGLGEK